jgi:hypothetical protein
MLKLLEIFVFIYGIGALIVKTFPTISAKYPWLISILTLLGNITNRQTDDAAVRAAATK